MLITIINPSSANAANAWIATGPSSTQVNDFALAPSNPSTIFVTTLNTNNGVWRSTNSGAGWTQVISATNYLGVSVKPSSDQVVLAGVSGGAIDRSTTGGGPGSWSVTGSGSAGKWNFGFSPSNTSTVYAGGFTNGSPDTGKFLKSTNSGSTWIAQAIDSDLAPVIYSLAVDPTTPDTIYAGVKPAGTLNDGLYKSTDGGANWTQLTNMTDTTASALAIDPADRFLVYEGTVGSGNLNRSTDGGSSWQTLHLHNSVSGFTSVKTIAIDPDESRTIYAGGQGSTKIIVSTDCGQSWNSVNASGIIGAVARILIDSTNKLVYAVDTAGGFYVEGLTTTAATGTCPSGNTSSSGVSSGSSGGGGGGGSPGIDMMLFFMLSVLYSRVRFNGAINKN